jgi:fumarate reductase flavoprotein subunit
MAAAGAEVDVLVIGGGLAGHTAALAAAEAGAEVLMVEKQPEVGGSTVLSGGFFAFADTDLQRVRGIADSPDLLASDLEKVGGGFADTDLVRAFAEGQTEIYTWFGRHGIRFNALELSSGQSVARSHQCDPRRVLECLGDAARATGRFSLRCGTSAERLRREGGEGGVTGAVIRDADGRESEVRVRGGVVMATGGFSRSEDLLKAFAPAQAKALRVGGDGNTGDGIRMGWKLGANLRDMAFVKGTFGAHPSSGGASYEILLAFYMGAIIVNGRGERFIDESLPYKTLGEAGLRQGEGINFQILDAKVMATSQPGVPLFDFQRALDLGLFIVADTVEALAEGCGMAPAALKRSLDIYNEGVRQGRDPVFGRDGLCNHTGIMLTIDQPPFYAFPSTTVVLSTYCGLAFDRDCRVIDVDGEPIEGLFAAGEVTGGFHGENYMTGTGLGKAAFFGRVAGQLAARRALGAGV